MRLHKDYPTALDYKMIAGKLVSYCPKTGDVFEIGEEDSLLDEKHIGDVVNIIDRFKYYIKNIKYDRSIMPKILPPCENCKSEIFKRLLVGNNKNEIFVCLGCNKIR